MFSLKKKNEFIKNNQNIQNKEKLELNYLLETFLGSFVLSWLGDFEICF